MELPSSAYLYTLALLAMTFVGFTAIVMILRQRLGGPVSRFDTLVARFFMASPAAAACDTWIGRIAVIREQMRVVATTNSLRPAG